MWVVAQSEIIQPTSIHVGHIIHVQGIFFNHWSNTMNKDQVDGKVNKLKGEVKEFAGKLVGDTELTVKGQIQKTIGKLQTVRGEIKQDIADDIKRAK